MDPMRVGCVWRVGASGCLMYAQHITPLRGHALGMHTLGFGTWQAAPGVVGDSVEIAIKAGFRHIDCAAIYKNQAEIGRAFHKILEVEKIVKRDELFIVSKLWNTDHHPQHVEAACRKTLSDLGLPYLDLYLIHWPVNWKHSDDGNTWPANEATGGMYLDDSFTLLDTWKAMEHLVDLGLTKCIGVSNYSAAEVKELMENPEVRIKPCCNQVEVNPGCPQVGLKAAQEPLGVVTVGYCPMGLGMSTSGGILEDPRTIALAQSLSITPGTLLLRWNLQKGNVVLTKSTTPSRIEEAAKLSSAAGTLSAETMAAVDAIGASMPGRVCNPPFRDSKAAFFNSL